MPGDKYFCNTYNKLLNVEVYHLIIIRTVFKLVAVITVVKTTHYCKYLLAYFWIGMKNVTQTRLVS